MDKKTEGLEVDKAKDVDAVGSARVGGNRVAGSSGDEGVEARVGRLADSLSGKRKSGSGGRSV